MKKICLYLLVIGLFTQCQNARVDEEVVASEGHALGVLQHNFQLSSASKVSFEEGLLLMHNFEYDDALTAFQDAVAADSTEIMAHWGEAMAHYKALWGLQKMEKGQAIMERIGETKELRLSNIDDPLEKDLWEGLEIIYGEGEFADRNKSYAKHMAQLHNKYPEDQEIAAFYALSLIWATDEYGDGSDDLILAANIVDKVINVNPNHPGALHYKIHALDGPVSAAEAKLAADAYAKVAPEAAHALHMPSHIYLALGEWEDVVNSNRASYDASVKRMERLGLKDGARGYHSFSWLHYGLLQQGRYEEAETVLKEMLQLVPNDPTKGARGYLIGMQNRHLVEAGTIGSDVQVDLDIKVDDMGLGVEIAKALLNARVAHQNNNSASINEQIKWLEERKEFAANFVNEKGVAMCAAGTTRYAATANTLKNADVVILQMKAMLAALNKDASTFEQHMIAATTLESETDYPTGPPRIAMPSFEQYGYWLLEKGIADKALIQFEEALKRTPNRTKSLIGKAQALQALDKIEEADLVESKLKEILKQADPQVQAII